MRWHAKWQSFNQKDTAQLEDWARKHFTSSMEVKRSAPGAEKSHMLGRGVWAAALPKASRHLQKVPGCKTASGALSLQHGILHSALHGQGVWKTHYPLWLNAVKCHRLTKNLIWIEAFRPILFRNSTKYTMMSPNVRGKMQ